jgi:hypothetical protein
MKANAKHSSSFLCFWMGEKCASGAVCSFLACSGSNAAVPARGALQTAVVATASLWTTQTERGRGFSIILLMLQGTVRTRLPDKNAHSFSQK